MSLRRVCREYSGRQGKRHTLPDGCHSQPIHSGSDSPRTAQPLVMSRAQQAETLSGVRLARYRDGGRE